MKTQKNIATKIVFNHPSEQKNHVSFKGFAQQSQKKLFSEKINCLKQFEVLQTSSNRQRQALIHRINLYISNTPKVFQRNGEFYVQVGKGCIIQWMKSFEERHRSQLFLQILQTIQTLTKHYGLFYIDMQMMKVSQDNRPCIWIHHNFKKNFPQFLIVQSQYDERIFFNNIKRHFNKLIQLPEQIKTLPALISWIKIDNRILKWKSQIESGYAIHKQNPEKTPKKNPFLNKLNSSCSNQNFNVQLRSIKSSPKIEIPGQYKDICLKEIGPAKKTIEDFFKTQKQQNLSQKQKQYLYEKKIRTQTKVDRSQNQTRQKEKISKHNNCLSIKSYGTKNYQASEVCSNKNSKSQRIIEQSVVNSSKKLLSEYSDRYSANFILKQQNIAIRVNKNRKNSSTISTLNRDWSLQAFASNFGHSTFSTRECERKISEDCKESFSPIIKGSKEIIVTQKQTNITKSEPKKLNKWIENNESSGKTEKTGWNMIITEEDDLGVTDDVQKLFGSDISKQKGTGLIQSWLMEQFDNLFHSQQCAETKLQNDYTEEFKDIIFD